jgi:hypothetical protein
MLYGRTMKTIAAAGASSGLQQRLRILITGPIPTICVALWVSQMNLPVGGRPDPDGAALVGYEHQADRCAKRWGASLQDCCSVAKLCAQTTVTHTHPAKVHHICYQTHVNTLGVSDDNS